MRTKVIRHPVREFWRKASERPIIIKGHRVGSFQRGGAIVNNPAASRPVPAAPTSIFGRIHRYVKDNRLISRGLNTIGWKGLGTAAAVLGYGRRSGGAAYIRV
jgi:hypothetical protein